MNKVFGQVMLRNLSETTTHWISSNIFSVFTNHFNSNGASSLSLSHPIVSSNGMRMVYLAFDFRLNLSGLFYQDLATTNLLFIDSPSVGENADLSMTPDGRFLVYMAPTNGTNDDSRAAIQVRLYDTELQKFIELLPATGDAPTNKATQSPTFSRNGQYLAYYSVELSSGQVDLQWRNLATNEEKAVTNLFVLGANSYFSLRPPLVSNDGLTVVCELPEANSNMGPSRQLFSINVNDGDRELVSDPAVTPKVPHHGLLAATPMAISGDGHYAAFASASPDLTSNSLGGFTGIFIRDLRDGTTRLISSDANEIPSGNSYFPAMSADGRFVTYLSYSTNTADTKKGSILLYDALTETNLMITPLGAPVAFNNPGPPSISQNADILVYTNNTPASLFIYDRGNRTNRIIISANTELGSVEVTAVKTYAIADGGRWVVANAMSQTNDIIILVDGYSGEAWQVWQFPGASSGSSIYRLLNISGNAARIAFETAPNSSKGNVVVLDTSWTSLPAQSGKSSVVASPVITSTTNTLFKQIELNADGRFLLYKARPDITKKWNIYQLDTLSNTTSIVSVNSVGTGTGSANSAYASMSPTGRYVVFQSWATNLTADTTFTMGQAFLRDMNAGVTWMLSRNCIDGAAGNSLSLTPVISGDGRKAYFLSYASDLIAGDGNLSIDLFSVTLQGNDTDQDGLDDDWEMTYFGYLSQNGSGDFDHDGTSNLEEFLAGTNPANNDLILRAITVSSATSQEVMIYWNSKPGHQYEVQYKDSVDDSAWKLLMPGVISGGSTTDSVTASKRFYRVLEVQ